MDQLDFTPRNVAKVLVKSAIAMRTAKAAEQALTDYTPLEEGSMAADLTGYVAGWYLADKLKPITDKVVDKTADYIVTKREARKAKKNTEKKD